MYRPSIALACLLAGSAVALLGGCPASHARIDESPHTFVEAWFDARCELALRCEYVAFRGSTSIDTCHPSARERWRRMADAVLAGDADFDGERALACVAALRSSECVVPLDATLPHEICRGVMRGAAPVGTACEPDGLDACGDGLGCELFTACPRCVPGGAAGESCVGLSLACAEGLQCLFFSTGPAATDARCGNERFAGEPCVETDFCRSDDPRVFSTCADGTCSPMTAVALGAECGSWIGNCPTGSYCGVDRALHPDGDVPSTCLPFRVLGESCDGASCAPGLRCDMGTCASIGELEDSCIRDDECGNDAPFCAFGRCGRDPEGTRCRPLATTAPIRDVCPDDLVCMLHGGVCLRPLELGASCERRLSEACGENARCVDDVCVPIVRPGGECASDAVCPPLHECNGGRCTPFPTIGEPCRDACYGGVCRDGRCTSADVGEACGHEPGDCEGACFVGECAEPLREGDLCEGDYAWSFCASPLECVREEDGAFRCRARSC